MQPKMQQCFNFYVFILVGTFGPWNICLGTCDSEYETSNHRDPKERLQFRFAFKH